MVNKLNPKIRSSVRFFKKRYYYINLHFINSINLNLLCNGQLDCKDKSDEASCEHIDIAESYRVDIPNGIIYLH